jgi:alkylation response protein AidB-like acyl-CoA dehydrogenase
MSHYRPPVDDIAFVLFDLLDAHRTLPGWPAFAELDQPLMRSVVEEAGRFAAEVLAPTNAVGDREGCRLVDGDVRTPTGFPQAYRAFWEAGWPALACDPAYGGQGLPQALNSVLFEMLSAANHGWTMYPGLLHGAYECIKAHASPELRERYLPKVVSGEWLSTMALTEPQAGSDLGLVRTRAEPQADGSYRITGDKIFISGADQDMSSNIVHLVLARLPDAPPGTRGLSLFLAPKFLPPYDGGGFGARNPIHVRAIEHKMGLAGSATCAVAFEGATGWLIGEPHRGLGAMFVMMNAARLHVGIQGLGHAEAAWQRSSAYAAERLQMKAVRAPGEPAAQGAADPIVRHPAVARLLELQRAWVEGGRMLVYWTALTLDAAEQHPDAGERAAAAGLVALMTPVVKSMLTENGFQCASLALQVFGGHGYVRETGIEQHLRDVRVAMIYEGTNEIQAIDLLAKKVVGDGGARLAAVLAPIAAACEAIAAGGRDAGATAVAVPAAAGDAALVRHAAALSRAVERLRALTATIVARTASDPRAPYRVASEYLRALGLVTMGGLWLRAEQACARAASAPPADGPLADPAFRAAKCATARVFFGRLLPECEALFAVIELDAAEATIGD